MTVSAASLALWIALRMMRSGGFAAAAHALAEGVVVCGCGSAAEVWSMQGPQAPVAVCHALEGEVASFPLAGFGELRVASADVMLAEDEFTALFAAAGERLALLQSRSPVVATDALRGAVEALGGFLQLAQLSAPASDRDLWIDVSETFAGLVALVDPRSNPDPALPSVVTPRPASRPRILVAEDVPLLQDLIRVQLDLLGYDADVVADGREAFDGWRRESHALVLTDLNMPAMDGVALVRAIREHEQAVGVGRRCIVLAVTAAAETAEIDRCLAAGMDGVLTKPLQVEALGKALRQWLPEAPPAAQPHAVRAPEASAGLEPLPVAAPTVFDFGMLEAQLGVSDPELHRALVRAFIDSAGASLAELARDGYPGSRVLAEMHKLKSSACTIGALRFAGLAIDLEKRTLAGEAWHEAHERQRLEEAFDELRVELERYLAADVLPAHDRLSSAAASALWNTCVIADDDPVMRGHLLSLVRSLGAQNLHPAADGEQALARIAALDAQVDLLLCDLQMPVLDGVEVLRRLGGTRFPGAIVLLSGADTDVLETAMDLAHLHGLRVLGALPKPASREALARLLNAAPTRRDTSPAGGVLVELSRERLLQALREGELLVHLQPQVDAATLQPVGVEALARWITPEGAWVPPGRFIPFAEEEGLIADVSACVLAMALQDASRLHRAGHRLRLSVNLSALWLEDLGLPDRITAQVEAVGLKPGDVTLEITETGLARDLATALDVLTRLRLRGFGLSLDDFGVGYSSFEQLRRLPFTEVKLDRGFVSNAGRDPASRAIVESMLEIARRLGLPAVAEGVEDEGDLALVRSLGCPKLQGYLFARPMAVEPLLAWLEGQRKA